MKMNIQTIDFQFSQQLYDTVQKKLQKIKRLCGDIISVDIRLTLDKAHSKLSKACGIRLVVPGYDLLSHTKSGTFEEAIAKSVEALERQIEKRKTKYRKQLILVPVNYRH